PKRDSMNRRVDVRSNTPELTNPPRANGETTSVGTRKPSPIGPAMPSAASGSGLTVRYSPGVPGGAVGGGTWSKNPPFSSYVMKTAVLAQSAAFDVSGPSMSATAASPYVTGAGGCSLSTSDASTHDTCGSVPAA